MSTLFYFLVIIPSAIFHEYMHGFVADQMGDPTARYAGRLTLNPIAHIDLWGTILLPLALYFASGGQFIFAYAKPVPYNPYNLKNQRTGPMWVAIAGPLANFFLALVFGLLFRFFPGSPMAPFFSLIVFANVLLGVFNLVPIPPLDGSKVLFALLPASFESVKEILERFGFMILLVFVFYLFPVLEPIIQYFFRLFIGA